jgi:hypothetical protein
MATEDDDLPDLLPSSRDGDKDRANEPPRPEAGKEENSSPPPPEVEEVGPAPAYDMQPVPDEHKEIAEQMHKRSRRRKRDRSLRKDDKLPSPFTVRQGWLDFLFDTPTLPMMLVFTFFFWPLTVPVAIFAAIIAHDADNRRNALMTVAFAAVPVSLTCCMGCMFGSMRH